MTNSWWKKTFNKVYFQAFSSSYSEERGEREVAFLIKALRLKKSSRVLDLGCGQGRHAIALARRDIEVVGVDSSAYLLSVAKRRANKARIQAKFIKQDMRTFKTKKKFEVVIILGNTFGYFSDRDNEKVLQNASASLKNGGRLVLDLPNTAGMLRNQSRKSRSQKIPGGILSTTELGFDPETFCIKLKWEITQHGKKYSFDGMLRLYTPPEIRTLLQKYRFSIEKTYGSFTKEPYSIETKRFLVIAKFLKKK